MYTMPSILTDRSMISSFLITNSADSFQNKTTLANRLSEFYKMIVIVLKTTFQKLQPKEIIYRNFENIELNKLKNDIRTKVQSAIITRHTRKSFLNH